MLCVTTVFRLGRADLHPNPYTCSSFKVNLLHLLSVLIAGFIHPLLATFSQTLNVITLAPSDISPGWCGSCFPPSVAVHLILCGFSIHPLFSATATTSDPELFSTLNFQPGFMFRCLRLQGPLTSLAEKQHPTCLL